jgi:hypothetical protein
LTWLSTALVPAILESIDVDAVLEQVDIEALLERIDLEALSRRIRIGSLVVEGTSDAAGAAVSMAHGQALDANDVIRRSMGRIMGRGTEENEDGPAGLE